MSGVSIIEGNGKDPKRDKPGEPAAQENPDGEGPGLSKIPTSPAQDKVTTDAKDYTITSYGEERAVPGSAAEEIERIPDTANREIGVKQASIPPKTIIHGILKELTHDGENEIQKSALVAEVAKHGISEQELMTHISTMSDVMNIGEGVQLLVGIASEPGYRLQEPLAAKATEMLQERLKGKEDAQALCDLIISDMTITVGAYAREARTPIINALLSAKVMDSLASAYEMTYEKIPHSHPDAVVLAEKIYLMAIKGIPRESVTSDTVSAAIDGLKEKTSGYLDNLSSTIKGAESLNASEPLKPIGELLGSAVRVEKQLPMITPGAKTSGMLTNLDSESAYLAAIKELAAETQKAYDRLGENGKFDTHSMLLFSVVKENIKRRIDSGEALSAYAKVLEPLAECALSTWRLQEALASLPQKDAEHPYFILAWKTLEQRLTQINEVINNGAGGATPGQLKEHSEYLAYIAKMASTVERLRPALAPLADQRETSDLCQKLASKINAIVIDKSGSIADLKEGVKILEDSSDQHKQLVTDVHHCLEIGGRVLQQSSKFTKQLGGNLVTVKLKDLTNGDNVGLASISGMKEFKEYFDELSKVAEELSSLSIASQLKKKASTAEVGLRIESEALSPVWKKAVNTETEGLRTLMSEAKNGITDLEKVASILSEVSDRCDDTKTALSALLKKQTIEKDIVSPIGNRLDSRFKFIMGEIPTPPASMADEALRYVLALQTLTDALSAASARVEELFLKGHSSTKFLGEDMLKTMASRAIKEMEVPELLQRAAVILNTISSEEVLGGNGRPGIEKVHSAIYEKVGDREARFAAHMLFDFAAMMAERQDFDKKLIVSVTDRLVSYAELPNGKRSEYLICATDYMEILVRAPDLDALTVRDAMVPLVKELYEQSKSKEVLDALKETIKLLKGRPGKLNAIVKYIEDNKDRVDADALAIPLYDLVRLYCKPTADISPVAAAVAKKEPTMEERWDAEEKEQEEKVRSLRRRTESEGVGFMERRRLRKELSTEEEFLEKLQFSHETSRAGIAAKKLSDEKARESKKKKSKSTT